jgi:hypothetical protein
MAHRLLFLLAGLALGLLGLFAPAEAQSQAGGLPAVSARVEVLEGIATTLQNQVTTLQTQVTTLRDQVTVLQTANTDLQNALSAEIAGRVQGDNALRAAVDSERLQRIAAIQTVTDLVTSAGQFFETLVVNTFLVEGESAVVATLGPLPAGNYLVTATLGLENTVHAARWLCTLFTQTGDQVPVTVIDSLQTHTSLGGIGVLSEFNSLALVGIARLPHGAATVKVNCGTGVSGSDIRQVQIVAVKVGEPG